MTASLNAHSFFINDIAELFERGFGQVTTILNIDGADIAQQRVERLSSKSNGSSIVDDE